MVVHLVEGGTAFVSGGVSDALLPVEPGIARSVSRPNDPLLFEDVLRLLLESDLTDATLECSPNV